MKERGKKMKTKMKTTRENVITLDKAERGGKCVCGNNGIRCNAFTNTKLGGVRVTLPNQQNGVWVCAEHREAENLDSYYEENNIFVGTATQDNITYSIEVESMGYSTEARAYLQSNDFLATQDSTVDIEYKSPIYRSLSAMTKVVGGIVALNNNEYIDFDVISPSVGCHTHIGYGDGHYDFDNTNKQINRRLWKPFTDYVESLAPYTQIALFGRRIEVESWAKPMDYSNLHNHRNWVNFQHRATVEFRVMKLKDAEAFMDTVKALKKVVLILTEGSCSAHDVTPSDAYKRGLKAMKSFKKYVEARAR